MTYSSLAPERDLWAYRSMFQRIHDSKMSQIGTCTIAFDIFLYWWYWSLGGRHTLFCTTNNHLLRRHKGTGNYVSFLYLDEEGETNGDTLVSRCYEIQIRLLSVNESKNPQHLYCGRPIPATHGYRSTTWWHSKSYILMSIIIVKKSPLQPMCLMLIEQCIVPSKHFWPRAFGAVIIYVIRVT